MSEPSVRLYLSSRQITEDEYCGFIGLHDFVQVGNVSIRLNKGLRTIKLQPEGFTPEDNTVWSFPNRGEWATHTSNYPGNWSPFVPRNLIIKYTRPGDTVCDQMIGGGTTLVECKLLDRNGIGVDINYDAAMTTMNRLDFDLESGHNAKETSVRVFVGDARNLNLVGDGTVDLVATHPPYAGIVPYSKPPLDGDLSTLKLEDYLAEMEKVASEAFRILKPNKHCAILIGDTREHLHYVPISIGVLARFLEVGFVLKEDIIKLQHNTRMSREFWKGRTNDFYKIAHEHLYVLRKPNQDENTSRIRYSGRWWPLTSESVANG